MHKSWEIQSVFSWSQLPQTPHDSHLLHRDGEMTVFGCFFLISPPFLLMQ